MKYDFTSIMDRMGKDAIAVEALGQNPMAPKPPKEGFDVIPTWVADMNFPTVPTIPEAIIERAKHPAYGYFSTRKEYHIICKKYLFFELILFFMPLRNSPLQLPFSHVLYQKQMLLQSQQH